MIYSKGLNDLNLKGLDDSSIIIPRARRFPQLSCVSSQLNLNVAAWLWQQRSLGCLQGILSCLLSCSSGRWLCFVCRALFAPLTTAQLLDLQLLQLWWHRESLQGRVAQISWLAQSPVKFSVKSLGSKFMCEEKGLSALCKTEQIPQEQKSCWFSWEAWGGDDSSSPTS